ncbi:A-kinase anchor protein 13-like isoform X3 [Centroberyx affinis]|uniref:A-kinase anchor protein 13-like isoform X3 n=1 Tax=Centroberyx affinis TaxID=166261 RepID=UPI003A5BC6E3
MKLNPQQAPLYGRCVISVQLGDEELAEDEDGVDYFLLFAGSTQRHLTSTLRSSHDTLQALCPAHDCCEEVWVSLCSISRGVPKAPEDPRAQPGRVALLAEHRFCFVQDLAFDMAQFLVSTAGRADGLEGALLLDECQIPLQECERLDESLALALHHLKLPPGWSLLGNKLTNSTDPDPQETLLHFSARRGLTRVAFFMLQQSGATEALRLANKQGHTPSAIAALRGHKRLQQLLAQAEVDRETDRGTETFQPVSTDARVVCHLPKLNTHTLTLGIYPGHDPPTLQRSVEQLQHLICHLHAKGVSTLELQSESLHTATECRDGVETETACLERLQQPTLASECLDTPTQGSLIENYPEDSSNSVVGGGDGEAGNAERDQRLSLSLPTSEQRPPDYGLGSPEDWVCLSPNTEKDYCQKEEEVREQPVVADQSLSLCDRSEGAQSGADGESLTVGTPAPACGKQTEETDRGETVIREGQEATEGKERSQQEAEESTVRRREKEEEETDLESRDPAPLSGHATISAMGQSQSSENSEASDTSDSDMKDCSQEGGDLQKEEMQHSQELCDDLSLNQEKPESEGLMDLTSTPVDLPIPSLIDCSDVTQEVLSDSAGPCPMIAGLHEGEPPPDINSLEQNQETAVRDYSTEQQWDLADGSSHLAPETGCHSRDCTVAASGEELDTWVSTGIVEQAAVPGADIESTSLPLNEPDNLEETSVENTADFQTASNSIDSTEIDLVNSEASAEVMPSSGNGQAHLDSGTTHGLSSDEEDSFRSVGSSTTEIFQPALETDRPNMEEQDLIQTKIAELASVGIKMAEQNDMEHGESNERSLPMDPELPLEHSTVNALTVTDCRQAGTEPESQLSPTLHTIEPLSPEGTGETLAPELSKEDLSLGPVLSESGDSPAVKVGEKRCETVEANGSDLNLETEEEHSVAEVTARVLFEPRPSVAEGREVTGTAEEDIRPTETSEAASAEENGETDVQLALEQRRQENLEMTADERSIEANTDEGLRHSGIQITMSSSDDVNPASDTADVTAAGAEPPSPEDGASSEPLAEDVFSPEEVMENPLDALDGASNCHSSPIQEMDVAVSEDMMDGPGEEEDSSTIHRDKEASFLQPSSTQHTGSSQSTLPSLTSSTSSRTSHPSTAHRDSGSDTESFLGAEPGDDSVFRKGDESVTGGDSTSEVSVSCSSTDDTASVGPPSSSPDGSQGLGRSWSLEEGSQTGATIPAGLSGGGRGGAAAAGAGGEAEEEAKDRVTEVPRRSCLLRPSVRSLSPLRRHSWGPGKNNGGDAEMNQRSSIRSPGEGKPTFHRRSYSLEGLSGGREELKGPRTQGPRILEPPRLPRQESEERGSLVSLTEEQEEVGEHSGLDEQKSRRYRPLRHSCPPMTLPLTKSVSMLTISQRDIDGMRSFSSASGSLAYSISEEEPGPLRSDTEGKSVTKVSRTFSYLKNKMYKKTREKDREKREKDRDSKEKDKRTVNGHLFTSAGSAQAARCSQCNKAFNTKEAFHCTHCNAFVHKGCRDSLPVCAKFPKQQFAVPDSSYVPAVTMRNKSSGTRERPWSAILSPDDHSSLVMPSSRRHTSIMTFHGNNLSKSLSISNIAGPVFDDMPIKGLRYLSQSTDSLNRTNQVTESMESLTDEGTEMMDGQLMGEFEAEVKELEADSWSFSADQQYLQHLEKELVKRQDVIYELMQTEMHHIRTLRIMSEVYSKGLQKEVQLEVQTVDKLFPALDELLELHTQHLLRLLERKKESQQEGGGMEGAFIINRIGDILVSQFSGSNAESMKRVYGRFCSRHNEAVNFYKELLAKDKRFKAFIKKKMSSSIVRRLGIPECILLVTQRITKYPVLIQRMLQHTKEGEEDFEDLTDAVRLVKEVIAAVDGKVNEHEKKRRLKEFHVRTDSKSIMMMKSGQMFAREDLLRRRLIHDGALQLKNSQGRLKDVHALLLSDVFVFLQEKDQKYVFALLDQRSTVISLQKLIVREVANEERGLFLITAGIEKPEMMEVLASSKDERNTWMQLIQDAMQSIEKDEDEGIPSETEDDKRQLETKAKEMRDLLRQKDAEIMSLLEEKVRLFRGMWEGLSPAEEASRPVEPFFRSACSLEPPRGAAIMKDALQEVETLQTLVNGSLGGAMASVQEGGGGTGPVCLPRRAETFGGFDSHQMSSSKNGDKDESEDTAGDLRRTESDSVLKKGGNANLLLLLKRNSEQVLHSVSNLHLLLSTLQAVVVQQDSFIEDQRQALSERPPSSSSSSCTSLTRPSSRPSSLIEQEKQRSLEKQRQELASLQRQQSAHAEERRRREKDWEQREQQLTDREVLLRVQEEEMSSRRKDLDEEKQELQSKKEEYQRDLERLRDAQRKMERDRVAVQRQLDKMEDLRLAERTPSSTSDDSQFPGSSQSLELDAPELSSSLARLQTQQAKPKKSLNPFTSSSVNPGLKAGDAPNQIPNSLLQLAKNKGKDRKEKKKKGKGGSTKTADPQHLPEPPLDGQIFFC